MSILYCRCCQLELTFPESVELLTCPACGTNNARPQAKSSALDALKRATRQRLNCDFYNAEISYQEVLREYPEEHNALWGRLLCHYGVEYVEERTGQRRPVVHTVRRKPMQEDGDFREACSCAPEAVRAQYEEEAAYIDGAMVRIRELAESCLPYDVFLCHKSTTLVGEGYTEDYRRAAELYRVLTQEGYRVFLAPVDMENIAGENYEAGIYHALDTAKVMLVVCSDMAHLTSAWVENEWKRFLEMLDEDPAKHLVPLLYGEMSGQELPREFRARGLQGLKMGELGAMEKLLETVKKYVPKEDAAAEENAETEAAEAGKAAVRAHKPAPKPVRKTAPSPSGFNAASDFTVMTVAGGCTITKYVGNQARVSIPPTIEGKPVVAVDGAFDGCRGLASVYLPESVTRIGDRAFSSCTRLTEMILPEGVTFIGKEAFAGCTGLTAMALPEGVTQIGEKAFAGCTGLTEVTLPDSVRSMEKAAFMGCTGLTEAAIPENVKLISSGLFSGCTSLRQITIADGVTGIEQEAFKECTSLARVELPVSLARMDDRMAGCTSLEEIVIDAENMYFYTHEGVLFSWEGELIRYPAAKKSGRYTVSERVQAIGAGAFDSCALLQELRIPQEVSVADRAFVKCAALKKVTQKDADFMKGLTSDKAKAIFVDCGQLKGKIQRKGAGEAVKKALTAAASWLFSEGWIFVVLPCVYGVTALVAALFGWLGWVRAIFTILAAAVTGFFGLMAPLARNSIAGMGVLSAGSFLIAAILGWIGWVPGIVLAVISAIVAFVVFEES